MRFVLILATLGGCDYVFRINEIEQPKSPCGPFETITVVNIINVIDPRQFSVIESEQRAMVVGFDGAVTRPISLVFNASADAWEPDMQQAGLEDPSLVGANVAPAEPTPRGGIPTYDGPVQPVMMAWSGPSKRHPYRLDRYYWSGAIWAADSNQFLILDPEYDTQAGNVVVVEAAGGERVRHVVLFKDSLDPSVPDQVFLSANSLTATDKYNLSTKPDRTLALNQRAFVLGQAVITQDQAKLIYSEGSGGQFDIFASAQSPSREFDAGGPIGGVNTNDDEVEPWIDDKCSRLYFRRVPAGRPNDAGQIFVAE